MRSIILIIGLFFFVSCNDTNKRNSKEVSPSSETTQPASVNSMNPSKTGENTSASNPDNQNSRMNPSETKEPSEKGNRQNTAVEGSYLKTGETNCACYCLNIQFNKASKLCIIPEKMYINASFAKTGSDIINVYFTKQAAGNTEGKDIPWEKFDTQVPIAKISPAAGGEIKLNWLGFTINGDLAIDYAIYGKKTLEGTYKKK